MFRVIAIRDGSEDSETLGVFPTEDAARAFLSRWADELQGFEAWIEAVTP